jgi:hypothetical protein
LNPKGDFIMALFQPPAPVHVRGTAKGEERTLTHGKEPGRSENDQNGYRSARDATSINPEHMRPIDPRMPNMPPP